jgi:hypothetical protein
MFLRRAAFFQTGRVRICFAFGWLVAAALSGCSEHDEGKTSPATAAQTNAVVSNSLPSGAAVQTTVSKEYAFKGAGTLRLTFPNTWVDKARRIMEGREPVNVIVLVPFAGNDFEISIEVRILGEAVTKNYDIRASLMQAGQMELTNCVEQSLDIQDFKGTEVKGSYYTVTDKRWINTQPEPGEYKYLTQGYAKLAGMVLKFRVISNRAPAEEKNDALEMMKSARFMRR